MICLLGSLGFVEAAAHAGDGAEGEQDDQHDALEVVGDEVQEGEGLTHHRHTGL